MGQPVRAPVSPSTVSELNQKIYGQIEVWRNRKIEGEHAYVYPDRTWLKRSWGGEVKNVAVLIATGVNSEGFREALGVSAGIQTRGCTVNCRLAECA